MCPVMNINNAATTDYFSPHGLCFILPSSHFQKGVVEGGSRLTKRWIKVCASAMFGLSHCCSPSPPHPLSLLFSLCMPHASPLLALSTLFLFTGFVYGNATYLTFQFSPCLGPDVALDTCQNFVSSGSKNITFLLFK